ncbi:MAG TPA: hypothetical protein VKM55_05955 [Candidatus Lokiarchaeia archaeon]|nr:hypothetical protein [Candidatus Lokiarchaeia archaeon]
MTMSTIAVILHRITHRQDRIKIRATHQASLLPCNLSAGASPFSGYNNQDAPC